MEKLKESKEYTIFKKRSGRYAIKGPEGTWINGADKVKILNKEGFVKGGMPSAKPKEEAPAPAAEAAAEEAAPAEEASTEEAPAEEAAAE